MYSQSYIELLLETRQTHIFCLFIVCCFTQGAYITRLQITVHPVSFGSVKCDANCLIACALKLMLIELFTSSSFFFSDLLCGFVAVFRIYQYRVV